VRVIPGACAYAACSAKPPATITAATAIIRVVFMRTSFVSSFNRNLVITVPAEVI
jgi:hypothetical protein